MSFDEIMGRYNENHPLAPIERMHSVMGDIVLALSGELEMKASNDIAPVLEAAILECPLRGRFALNLARVGYISSTGVGLLATCMSSAQKRSITLVLVDIPPRVRSIMDTLGLIFFFNLEDSHG